MAGLLALALLVGCLLVGVFGGAWWWFLIFAIFGAPVYLMLRPNALVMFQRAPVAYGLVTYATQALTFAIAWGIGWGVHQLF